MKKGFTLIELLVVIVIIAILAAVIFVALDPITRFKQARDSNRWNAVNNILTAVHECIVDEEGIVTECGLTAPLAETQLGTDNTGCTFMDDGTTACGTVADCVDLSGATELGPYLASIPNDPAGGSAGKTGYTVQVDGNGIVWIRACNEEEQADPPGIFVAR